MNAVPTQTVILGGGCFWCLEAVFNRVEGVIRVEPGYAGGHVDNPTYDQVCAGQTGHAEVLRVTFDASLTTLDALLDVFFALHDPTTENRQGNDVGTQYRSVVFCRDDAQRQAVRAAIDRLTAPAPMPRRCGRRSRARCSSGRPRITTSPTTNTIRCSPTAWR